MAIVSSGNALLPIFVCSMLLFCSVAFGITDSPFIVAQKKVSTTRLKSGAERISVSIDIFNKGSATAYDVSLNDDSWDKDRFDLVTGTTSNSWERLDMDSVASHSFVLESKIKGMFYGAPAVIKFRAPSRATFQAAYSTPIMPLDILADRPPVKKFDLVMRLVANYGSLVSVLLIVGTFVYVVVTPSKSSAAKASKKRR